MKNYNEETGEVIENDIVLEPVEKNRVDELDTKTWFEYNAKLQQKKNIARKILSDKGTLKKKGENTYDNYKYFTEAQYKEVSNELLVGAKIEIKAQLKEMYQYSVLNSKTPVGRIARMVYSLIDTETGFYEDTYIEGEGLDRGDKAGYKAYTGAVKYFLANTFLVPTGDDPEKESPEAGDNAEGKTSQQRQAQAKKPVAKQATKEQIDKIKTLFQSEKERNEILKTAKIQKLEDLTDNLANYFIAFRNKQLEQRKNEIAEMAEIEEIEEPQVEDNQFE